MVTEGSLAVEEGGHGVTIQFVIDHLQIYWHFCFVLKVNEGTVNCIKFGIVQKSHGKKKTKRDSVPL